MKALRLIVVSMVGIACGRAEKPALRLDLGGGTTMDLVLVRAGVFTQGSAVDEPGRGNDEDQRQVRISRDYYISRTAVTRGQWERFVAESGFRSEAESGTSGGYGWDGAALSQRKAFHWRNPGFSQTPDHPVCLVTFPDAQAFCAWLERKTHRVITLPSEAQWEFACRADTRTAWHAGSTAADGDRCAWHKGNAGNGTRPADSREPNGWGLVIGGNVAEWCLDWYAPYQPGEVSDPRQDHPNLSDKPRRVLRGGSWLRDAKNTRSAARYRADPRSRNADIGFRIVCGEPSAAVPPTRNPNALKAEADMGFIPAPASVTEPPLAPEPVTTHSVGSRSGGLIGSLLCFVAAFAVIVLIVRMILRSQTAPTNPFVVQPSNRSASVREVDDGFWVHGDWPVGTALQLHYLINSAATDQELIYRPGPDGHFVYTGLRPHAVTVVETLARRSVPPPPVLAEAPDSPDRDDTRRPAGPPPPIFPSAY